MTYFRQNIYFWEGPFFKISDTKTNFTQNAPTYRKMPILKWTSVIFSVLKYTTHCQLKMTTPQHRVEEVDSGKVFRLKIITHEIQLKTKMQNCRRSWGGPSWRRSGSHQSRPRSVCRISRRPLRNGGGGKGGQRVTKKVVKDEQEPGKVGMNLYQCGHTDVVSCPDIYIWKRSSRGWQNIHHRGSEISVLGGNIRGTWY